MQTSVKHVFFNSYKQYFSHEFPKSEFGLYRFFVYIVGFDSNHANVLVQMVGEKRWNVKFVFLFF